MSNLLASFNAGVSGLQSAQASLNTASHNIANAHTPGYTRQQVIITDSFYQNSMGAHSNLLQVGTGTVIVQTRQIRNTFLDGRYRLEFGRQGFYEQNRAAAREVEDMLGELEGEQFKTTLTDMWKAFSELAKDPGNVVNKDELVSMASQFIERAQVVRAELNTYQTSLNSEVIKQVDQINNLVSQIHELNKQIRRYEANGESANDYRDKRNECLDQLSYLIDFEVNEEKDGVITIYAEGAFLLDTHKQNFLTTEYDDITSKQNLTFQLLKPVWENGGDFFQEETLSYSHTRRTDVGSLRGLLVARGNYAANYTDTPVKPEREGFADQQEFDKAMAEFEAELEKYNNFTGASVIMSVQSQLDILVHGVVTRINDLLCQDKELVLEDGTTLTILDEDNAMVGDDANHTMGTELFSRRGVERYTEMVLVDDQGNPLKDKDGNPLVDDQGQPLKVKVYNKEDPTDIYSMYTIGQLVINPDILKDSSTLPVMYNPKSDKKDGYAMDEINKIADLENDKIGKLNPNSLTSYATSGFYDQIVGELSSQGSVWNGIIDNQEMTVASVDGERHNVMSVSTEEELSDLIKFQRCYDASSRYITTVAEMLEYLIERLG